MKEEILNKIAEKFNKKFDLWNKHTGNTKALSPYGGSVTDISFKKCNKEVFDFFVSEFHVFSSFIGVDYAFGEKNKGEICDHELAPLIGDDFGSGFYCEFCKLIFTNRQAREYWNKQKETN